jgi:TatD DNase family protein
MLIDTHAHIHFSPLGQEPPENILARAQKNGVGLIINVGSDLRGSKISVQLSNKFENIYAAVGIHPHEAEGVNETALRKLESLLKEPKVVVVGEIGLDYFKNISPAAAQKKVLEKILEMAAKYDKPIIIHNRDADQDIYEILKDCGIGKIVFHCFSSTKEFAKKILDLGYFISFTGNITFPKNLIGQEVVKYVPLERIMLETDCPFLAPVPHRGQTNEPAYVKYIAEKIAELKATSVEEVASATSANARSFFGLG